MGGVARYHFQRRALCVAVALLMPASFMAAQAQTTSTAAASGPSHGPARAVIPPPSGVAPAPVNPTVRLKRPKAAALGAGRLVLRSNWRERLRAVSAESVYDIPLVAAGAYQYAAAVLRRSAPTCHLKWTIIAAIGAVESNHGQFAGAKVLPDGTTSPRIVGLPLNGHGGVAKVRDTDRGALDGDKVWDRAVGPLQFLPSTWAITGVDADQDGVRNPYDIDDAALAMGSYMCAGASDFRKPPDARAAVYGYNHSRSYVDVVLRIAAAYDRGGFTVVSDIVLPEAPELALHRVRDGAKASQRRHAGDARPGGNLPARRDEAPRQQPHAGRSHHSSSHHGSPPPGGGTDDPPPTTDPTPEPPPAPTPEPTPTPVPTPTPDPTPEPTPTPTPTPAPAPTPTPTPEPTPTPTPTPAPAPTPTPTPAPTPTPTPDPEPQERVHFTGVLTVCGDSWCVDDVPLDLGVDPDLSAIQRDYDGDTVGEPVADELAALVGTRVRIVTEADGLVRRINHLRYVAPELPADESSTGTAGRSAGKSVGQQHRRR